VVCADDPILLAESQRAIAERIGATVHTLPGDHSPFLSRPAELAAILTAIVTG
jgi:pimeloyl-ACP methyl ester carboxylesterase